MSPPSVPDVLRVPQGEELVFEVHAVGVQIYVWQSAKGSPAWMLKAPQADLLDDTGRVIGTHFSGPAWRLYDGSEVSGKLVAQAESPDSSAIPWLLLAGTKGKGNGPLSRATSIHRINTRGGLAPSGAGQGPGEERSVSYSADYYFYAPGNL